ncbi:DUF6308 family protein [Streptomyces sp. NRAIS4]
MIAPLCCRSGGAGKNGHKSATVPVYDRVVRCALGRPRPSFWLALHAALREDDGALHRQLGDCKTFGVTPDHGRCIDDQ